MYLDFIFYQYVEKEIVLNLLKSLVLLVLNIFNSQEHLQELWSNANRNHLLKATIQLHETQRHCLVMLPWPSIS